LLIRFIEIYLTDIDSLSLLNHLVTIESDETDALSEGKSKRKIILGEQREHMSLKLNCQAVAYSGKRGRLL
jgi:hypothetical protein